MRIEGGRGRVEWSVGRRRWGDEGWGIGEEEGGDV